MGIIMLRDPRALVQQAIEEAIDHARSHGDTVTAEELAAILDSVRDAPTDPTGR